MNSTNTKLDYEFEKRKRMVKNSIRICTLCGNIGVKIDNYGIYCRDCDLISKRGVYIC